MGAVVQCIERFPNGAAMYAGGQDLLICQHVTMTKPIDKMTQQHTVTRAYWCRDDGTRDGDYIDLPTSSHVEAVRYAWQDIGIEVHFHV